MSDSARFECAPGLRLQAHERLSEVHHRNMEQRLERIEKAMERLEKRWWLSVYGMVAVILTQALRSLLDYAPVLTPGMTP